MKSNLFQIILSRLFPALGKAQRYRRILQTAAFNPHDLEQQAIVEEAIIPYLGGRVRYQHSWWPALCQQNITLFPGERVYVVGRHNLILLVKPASCFTDSPPVNSSNVP